MDAALYRITEPLARALPCCSQRQIKAAKNSLIWWIWQTLWALDS